MKNLFLGSVFILLINVSILPQKETAGFPDFEKYFLDETMRIDYYHIGNSKEEFITLDQIYKYGIWAGSRVHLMDEMNLGRYCVKIYDADSGRCYLFKRI